MQEFYPLLPTLEERSCDRPYSAIFVLIIDA